MLNRRIRKIISSSKRDKSIYPSPSHYRIPVALPGRPLSIELRNFSIPNSIYNVDSRNDQIIINSTAVQIKHGNYTPSALAAEVTAAVNNELGGIGFVVAYSGTTAKMTVSYTGVFTMAGTILETLGFSGPKSDDLQYAAENVVNLSYTSVLYLRLNNLSMGGSALGEIGLIYNDVGFGEMITGNSISVDRGIEWCGDAPAFTEFEISFVDESGHLIDFNGANHTLEFDILYRA